VLEAFPSHRDDAAIWLFSGGTTGQPKAVVQRHESFANTTVCYGQRVLGFSEDDVTLAVPKLFFGYATGSNLFFPFSVGAAAALFAEKATAETLFEKIRRFRPTVLINVPTMINQMVSHPDTARQDLSSLRLTTSAGEALPVELYERWRQVFGVELLDGLGTAEMWHIFISNRPGGVRAGTLGTVVPGFDVKVCDDDGRELPDGEVGCLWVCGNSRATGYWQQMDKTRAAFRGDWYVSGDLIRRERDGYFAYCGRADDLLKVGGKWLAPQEVEGCLLQHPLVKEVAVVGVEDANGLTKPHAFVVATERHPGLGEELQAFARERLEPYKAPRAVRFLDALPRTHLGKVDRAKLRRA
jgi:benzoate-CoA ligase family protein